MTTSGAPCKQCELSLLCLAGHLRVRQCVQCNQLYAIVGAITGPRGWYGTQMIPCTRGNTLATDILRTNGDCPHCRGYYYQTVTHDAEPE